MYNLNVKTAFRIQKNMIMNIKMAITTYTAAWLDQLGDQSA